MVKHPHTPGPWTLNAEASHPWIVECPQDDMPEEFKGQVCTVDYRPNASLIAAAPELLAFIQEIAKRDPVFAKGWQKKHIADAIALVAKAEGSQP